MADEEPIEGEMVPEVPADALVVLPKGVQDLLRPLDRSEYPLSLTTGQAVEEAALAAVAFSEKFLPAILKKHGIALPKRGRRVKGAGHAG